MRAKNISLFFVMIVCFFGISDFVFAMNAIDLTRTSNIRVKDDRDAQIIRRDELALNSGIHYMASDLSKVHKVSGTRNAPISRSSEMIKVLSVIEKRVGDKALLKKIADKLTTMSDDRLQTIASLSKQIAAEEHGTKTDIAFLLLTTLIVFS